MKRLITICLVLVLLGPSYARAGTWTTLPDIPGQSWIWPSGVSGGTIVGTWNDGHSSHGFVYDGASYTILDYPGYPPPGWSTFFCGVQGNTVVGSHGITGWTFDGLMYNISTHTWTNVVSPFPGFPHLHDLSGIDGDKLVGSVWDGQQTLGQSRAVLYDGTSWSIIQPPGSPATAYLAISGNTVVGYYADSARIGHGFIYDGTNYTTVDWPGATHTDLRGISGNSMVGNYVDALGVCHGLLYDGTAWTTLDMPGATVTCFTGIDASTVVGVYYDASGMTHGLIYTIPEPATPPIANAGNNIQIPSSDQAHTTIQGTATDLEGDLLEYRWLDGAKVILDWSAVGENGQANLDLGTLPHLSFGNHILRLEVREVREGGLLTSDTMILTIASPASIVGWGDNYYGQASPPAGNDFVAIAAGLGHNLALKSDGSIVGWGRNFEGQCNVPPGNDFVAIAAGGWHSLALKSDGSIVSWGWNYFGQASAPAGNDFVAIAAGYYHSLALKSDGSIVAWGYNGWGQSNVPTGNDFVAIGDGSAHSLALKSDGSLVAWGWNDWGQLNNIPTGNGFVAISAGYWHSLSLKQDGSIVGWGWDYAGQVSPPDGNDFVAIAAGNGHSLALKTDGSIVGWGYNEDGRAGPPPGDGNNFVAIAAGNDHSLALKLQNNPPVADAGANIQIPSSDQANTTIQVIATDPEGDPLEYRWLEGDQVLLDWSPAGQNGEANLNLGNIPRLSVGDHILTLEVREAKEGGLLSSDTMILTIADQTPPVISAGTPAGTPGSNDWWRSDVNMPFSATDDLSGFAPDGALSINMASKTTSGEGSALYVTSDDISDMAGNVATGIQSGPFKVDWTPPTLAWGAIDPAPNAAGWNNSVPVKIPFTTDDNLSGVATAIPPSPLSFNAEGQNQTQNITVTDFAGNSATFASPPVNIDKTPPIVTITLPSPITVILNQPGVSVVADWSATDNLSGVVPPTNGTITQSLNTGTVGTRTANVTGPQGTAVDTAGNPSVAVTVVYTYYVRYDFSGILPPINPDGSSIFKLGSTIPVKFQLRDAAGNFITSAVAKIYVAKIADSVIGTEMEAVSTSTATTGNLFRYDSTSNQYIFNLGTKTLSTGGWQIRIELDDGTSKYVLVSLK